MFDMTLFRDPTFAGANTVALLVSLAMFGVFFFISLFMQNVLGYSAVRAGVAFLPMTVLIILVAPVAGKASDRLGSRWLMTGGMTLVGCALLVFAQLQPDSSYLALLPGMVLGGFGMAITMTPMTAAALSSVPVDKAGSRLRDAQHVPPGRRLARDRGHGRHPGPSGSNSALAGGASQVDAFVNGLHQSLYTAALIAFVGALDGSRHDPEPRPLAAGRRERRAPRRHERGRRRPGYRRRSGDPRSSRPRFEVFGVGQLHGLDDGRDRAGSGRLRADHLPALRVEEGALVRLPRRGVARAPDGDRAKAASIAHAGTLEGVDTVRAVAVVRPAAPEPLAAGRHRGG